MRTCPKCYTENMDNENVCRHCASTLQQAGGKTCPNGHPMDPTWRECQYCSQDNAASAVVHPSPSGRAPTLIEPVRSRGQAAPHGPTEAESAKANRTPYPPRPLNKPVSPQRPASPQPATPSRDATIFRPAITPNPSSASAVPPVTKERKIVGVLISYSWIPEGKIFPVLEGRNFIGRDKDCEISIPEDESMSGRNSHITYRQNFVVGDLISMTGTDLNGVPIEEQFHSLANYSTIRAGSTYFTFIASTPPSTGAAPPQAIPAE